jgi:single stranded DNA-binding protein
MSLIKKHIIVGNLTSAVTLKSNGDRDSIAFTVAVNEGKNQQTGEQYTTYHSVIASGKKGFASNVTEYLTKGKGVSLVGTPYMSVNEKDNNVYENHGIRLTKLADLRFSGSDVVAPATGTAQAAPAAQANAEAQSAALADAAAAGTDQQQPAPQPTPDFDAHDDDIPF